MRSKLTKLALAVVISCGLAAPVKASEIPLGTSGGVYTVPVQVNRSMTLSFLVDPGAGVVVIPLSVLRNLIGNGSVTEADVIGVGTAETADSSVYLTARVRLRELRIGDAIVRDVIAAVAPGLSQPLLGQTFLQRFAAVTFDNRRHLMILSDDGGGSSPAAPPASAWVTPYPAYPGGGAASGGGYGYGAPGYAPGLGR